MTYSASVITLARIGVDRQEKRTASAVMSRNWKNSSSTATPRRASETPLIRRSRKNQAVMTVEFTRSVRDNPAYFPRTNSKRWIGLAQSVYTDRRSTPPPTRTEPKQLE